MNRREILATCMALTGLDASLFAQTVTAGARSAARRSFMPGELWLDTSNKPIQAHGGSIIGVGDDFAVKTRSSPLVKPTRTITEPVV